MKGGGARMWKRTASRSPPRAHLFTPIRSRRRIRTIDVADGKGGARIVYSGGEIAAPGGLALSPDQAMLIVTDADKRRLAGRFRSCADGSLMNGEPFYRLEMPEAGWMSGVAGVSRKTPSARFISHDPAGIQMCEANGRVARS